MASSTSALARARAFLNRSEPKQAGQPNTSHTANRTASLTASTPPGAAARAPAHTAPVKLQDVLLGALRIAPELPAVLRGAWNLADAKPIRRDSIGRLFERLTERHPHRVALRFGNRQWSYGELNAWANRYATLLRKQGVGAGAVVAILSENHPEVLALLLATVKLGAIAGMCNYNQRGEVLAHSLRLMKPRVVIVGDNCAQALLDVRAQLNDPTLVCGWVATSGGGTPAATVTMIDMAADARRLLSSAANNPPETRRVALRAPALYIFTSGTTGLPKASVMTHYRWMRCMSGLGQMALRLNARDTLYCPLPLYHNNALTVSLGAVLGAGATLALGRKFSASRFWDEIRATHATAFCYIGELCRYLMNTPANKRDTEHNVRLIVGNGLRPEIWEPFRKRFGIQRVAEFYGASEGNVLFVNAFNVSRTAGFCPMKFAIVAWDPQNSAPRRDEHGRLREVARGQTGLLLTAITERSPFDGYTDALENTGKLVRDAFEAGDSWLNTGDLVCRQGWGHIAFVDRLGDTFRWKGENVSCTEVEGVLMQFPAIQDAAVYGVAVPGSDGRAGMAALVLRRDVRKLDLEALHRHLRARLPAYAVPQYLRVSRELATTATFKNRKVELRDEGYNPDTVRDPLYRLDERKQRYTPMHLAAASAHSAAPPAKSNQTQAPEECIAWVAEPA